MKHWITKLKRPWLTRRWRKWSLGILVGLMLLLTTTLLALPHLVRSFGGGWLREHTGRTLTLGDLSLNLLTWKLVVDELAISEPNRSERFAGFRRLEIQVSPLSIFKRALIVTRLELNAPWVQVLRDGDRFNFSDFAGLAKADEAPSKEPEEKNEPFRFSLNNLRIVKGEALYVERENGTEIQRHTVHNLRLAVPFVGNIPHLLDRYVTPSLSLVVNDAPLSMEGKLKLFTEAVEVALALRLNRVDIPFYFNLLPETPPIRVRSGRLGADLDVLYRTTAEKAPELWVGGKAYLSDIDLAEASGADLLKLAQVNVDLAPSKVLDRQLHLNGVYIYSPTVELARDPSGVWNFSRLARPAAAPASPPEAEKPSEPRPAAENAKPLLTTLKTLLVKNGRINFRDALPEGGFQREIDAVDLTLRDFSTAPKSSATYALSLRTNRKEQLQVTGKLTLDPLAVATTVDLAGVGLEDYYPYLAPYLTAPVSGSAALQAGLDFSGGIFKVADAQLALKDLRVPFGGDEGVKLARLRIAGCRFDGGERRLDIASIELSDGGLVMSRSRGGRLSYRNLLREPATTTVAPETPKPAKESEPAPPEKPFHYRLRAVAAHNLGVTFIDQAPKKPVKHVLGNLELSLENLAGPEAATSPFRVKGSYGRNGKFDLSGEVVAATGKLHLRSRLKGIALPAFAPYFPDSVRLVLADGQLDTDLSLRLEPGADGLDGSFSGTFGIRNCYVLDSRHRAELVRWGSLQVENIQGDLRPFRLRIGGIALSDYTTRIVIDQAGLLNLNGILVTETPEGTAPSAPAPPEAVAKPVSAEARPEIAVDAITLQAGTVSFTDRQMQPVFSTTMYQLGGRMGKIANQGKVPAEVDLRGHLENLSPLRISGEINPLGEDLFADIRISFKDIELAPATPYTGTYLGYAVEKGKLNLDLEYKIAEKALRAQNQVLIDQFTFGRAVKSERAVNLPVKLAVALLKDRDGKIKLNIPVAGRTDDPEFSVWSVVLKILKNLLIKAATSPLSLLQAVMGDGEDITAVSFAFGSAEVPVEERQKLDQLAAMLKDRPALRLEIAGLVDSEQDPEGYRKAQLQKRMGKEKFLDLVEKKENLPGQTEADVEIAPDEYLRYLEKVYQAAKFPKPRNILGLDKSLPETEMEKLILTNIEVGPEQLRGLAQARAAAVMNYLTKTGGLETERLFLMSPDLARKPKARDASGNRVEFGVVAR